MPSKIPSLSISPTYSPSKICSDILFAAHQHLPKQAGVWGLLIFLTHFELIGWLSKSRVE